MSKKKTDIHAPLDLGSAEDRKKFLEAAFEADDGNISVGGLYVEMAKSLTLNDFVEQPDFPERFKESFKPGETEIWYRLNGKLRDDPKQGLSFLTPKPPKISELEKTHVKIGSVAETHNDTIFYMMQAENWQPMGSPRGSPAAMFLNARGAEHSSMSVGDVIKIGDRAWMVAGSGFTELQH